MLFVDRCIRHTNSAYTHNLSANKGFVHTVFIMNFCHEKFKLSRREKSIRKERIFTFLYLCIPTQDLRSSSHLIPPYIIYSSFLCSFCVVYIILTTEIWLQKRQERRNFQDRMEWYRNQKDRWILFYGGGWIVWYVTFRWCYVKLVRGFFFISYRQAALEAYY